MGERQSTSQCTSEASSIDGDLFVVLINQEGQHSIWPAAKAVPAGWRCVNASASKSDSLAFVEGNWTDMRPKSLQTDEIL